jgi:hypothetical protein
VKRAFREISRILFVAWTIALPTTSQAGDDDVQSARAFLEGVYAKYADGDSGPSIFGRGAEDLFAPGLLRLIREDRRLAQGEVGLLDHDPICSCQDTEGLTLAAIQVTPTGQRQAKATAIFVNGGHPVRVGFTLVQVSGDWRIQDIEERGMPSLSRFLRNGLVGIQAPAKH